MRGVAQASAETRWTAALAPEGDGTRVDFLAEGELPGAMRLAGPLMKRLVARQFAGYHENLRRSLEGA